MNKLFAALVATALSAPAVAAAQDVAPAVKRKPAPAATTAAPGAAAAPQTATRNSSEQHYQAALTAAVSQSGGDAALDSSLIRVMSRLLAAGQCGQAASLANRDGRKELASRAQQLCK